MSESARDPEHEKALIRRGLNFLQNFVGDDGRINVTALVDDYERLRAALQFYATPDNWRSPSNGFALQYDPAPSPIEDAGKWVPAEKALSKGDRGHE